MKKIVLAIIFLLGCQTAKADWDLPIVYGWHHDKDPDGVRRWYWYRVTPLDAESGWVVDKNTNERVWWRWVGGKVIIYRTQ